MGIFDNLNMKKRENENVDDFMDIGEVQTGIWGDDEDGMNSVVDEETQDTSGSFSGINESAVSLKLITPKGLADTEKIADYLIAGSSVVLNIEEISSSDVIRFMDYLHGVLHVIHGNMKQVSKTTFVATPNNVGIDTEENNAD